MTAHLLVLKRNLLGIGIQYIFICWLLCVYNSAQTVKELFYSLPQETENNHCSFESGNALSKARISCENHMLVFIPSLHSFSNHHQFFFRKTLSFFHLWICWANFKVKNMFHCIEFESRHRNPAGCLGELLNHIVVLCQRSTSVRWGAESVKCFRSIKTCSVMYSH